MTSHNIEPMGISVISVILAMYDQYDQYDRNFLLEDVTNGDNSNVA